MFSQMLKKKPFLTAFFVFKYRVTFAK